MTELEISCLPKDLPEFLEVDISELELDQMLNVSDIKLPEGTEITELLIEQNPAIVSIQEIKEIIEEDIEGEDTEGESEADDASDSTEQDQKEEQGQSEGDSGEETPKDD